MGLLAMRKGQTSSRQPLQAWLTRQQDSTIHFRIQWTEPFSLPEGGICEPDDLGQYPQVKIIDRPLLTDDYQALLQTTDCMILPYRNSLLLRPRFSDCHRSRSCLGIPLIYTKGGWLRGAKSRIWGRKLA